MKKSVPIILVVLIIILFCLPAFAKPCDFSLPPKNILVLFSYSPSYPSSDMLFDSLNKAFEGLNVHMQVEYMDTKLIDPEYEAKALVTLLQKKIELLGHIDLIITFDDNALAFIDQYYETIFGPDSTGTIPIVFSGCNDFKATEAIYHSRTNIAGGLEHSSSIKTIEIATKLIPDYNSITVLVDNSATSRGMQAQLIAENSNNYPLTFINATDYTFEELSAELAKLTPKDIFFFISSFEDKTGRHMTYNQTSNFLHNTVNSPIFCATSYCVDTLFAGGYVHDKSQSGYDVGILGKSIIFDGVAPETYGLNDDKAANMIYMFNVSILASFNINTLALPQDALRIHHSSTSLFTDTYPDLDQKLVFLSLFLGICIFIVAGFAFYRHGKAVHHEKIALTDPLTGAGSRMALDTKLDILINYCEQNGVSSTLVFLDIDGFKTINDQYGHPVGDEILKQVIDRIQSVLSKKSDVYRYGGDEFVLLMRSPANEAKQEVNRIVSAFAAPFTSDKQSVCVNLSMGAVEIPTDGLDATMLIQKADMAMYAAKTFNSTRAIFYSNLH